MHKILVFGTSTASNYLYNLFDFNKVKIEAFVLSKPLKDSFHGIRIIGTDEISAINYDYIVIASGQYEIIKNELTKFDVPENKIVGFIFDKGDFIEAINKSLNKNIDDKTNRDKMPLFLKDNYQIPRFYAQTMWFCDNAKNNCYQKEYVISDYVREQMLLLLANEIKANNILGSVAELGVYKGDFAKRINYLFPEQTLYLFDTFEGFDMKDLNTDKSINNYDNESRRFKDTSIEYVLNCMPFPEKCIVKKGYFPDTFDLSSEKFCFVSIDTDLYEPIYLGLEKFYPRLSKGGYIMVHDVNNCAYKGAYEAVKKYCYENSINYIPIPDFFGSVIITK